MQRFRILDSVRSNSTRKPRQLLFGCATALLVLRACVVVAIAVPYLYYDEQIYFWTARHYARWGTFHCGFDLFPALRVLYQGLIAPVCAFPLPLAFRLIQAVNLGLYAVTLAALGWCFYRAAREHGSDPRCWPLALLVAGLAPTFWCTGQIMPENLMLACTAIAAAGAVGAVRAQRRWVRVTGLSVAVLFAALACLSKPHALFIVLPLGLSICVRSKRRYWLSASLALSAVILLLAGVTVAARANAPLPHLFEQLLHVSQVPNMPHGRVLLLWLFEFLRYLTLPVLACGIIPPLALVYFALRAPQVGRVNRVLTRATLAAWILAAVTIAWFASWRNVTYWSADVFERYYGLVLPLVAGAGMLVLLTQLRPSRRAVCTLAGAASLGCIALTPVLSSRTDENAPGMLAYYLLSEHSHALLALLAALTLVISGAWLLRRQGRARVVFPTVVMALMTFVTAARLHLYSRSFLTGAQPFLHILQKHCTDHRPFVLLSAGIIKSWLYPRLCATMPWIEFDITGISNSEIELQASGTTLVAGSKWIAAPDWYELHFPCVASTNGFSLYWVSSNSPMVAQLMPDFTDTIHGLDDHGMLGATNLYSFFLPGETALVARAGIELRTDCMPADAVARITIADACSTNGKTKVIHGQTGLRRTQTRVTRPSSDVPFQAHIFCTAPWPLLRAWTDFPLISSSPVDF